MVLLGEPLSPIISPSRPTQAAFTVVLDDWSTLAPFLSQELAAADARRDTRRPEQIAASMGMDARSLRERLAALGFHEPASRLSRPSDRRRHPPSACPHHEKRNALAPLHHHVFLDDEPVLQPRAPLPYSKRSASDAPLQKKQRANASNRHTSSRSNGTLHSSCSLPTLPLSPAQRGAPSNTRWTEIRQGGVGAWTQLGKGSLGSSSASMTHTSAGSSTVSVSSAGASRRSSREQVLVPPWAPELELPLMRPPSASDGRAPQRSQRLEALSTTGAMSTIMKTSGFVLNPRPTLLPHLNIEPPLWSDSRPPVPRPPSATPRGHHESDD